MDDFGFPEPSRDYFAWKRMDTFEEVAPPERWAEFSLFVGQERLNGGLRKRREEFEARVLQERALFVAGEQAKHDEIAQPYMRELRRAQTIQEIRRKAIPAYTFDHFTRLPLELQLRIWDIACRFEEPREHAILPIPSTPFEAMIDRLGASNSTSMHSSRIQRPRLEYNFKDHEPFPKILSVCRTSRAVALKTYSLLATRSRSHSGVRIVPNYSPRGEEYFNTTCDTFYVGGGSAHWHDFKVLVDIAIKFNTSRPLREGVQDELNGFLKIQNLMVDFEVFATAPVQVWTAFSKLENLTVFLDPNLVGEEDEEIVIYQSSGIPKRKELRQGSIHQKRAKFITAEAQKRLEDCWKKHSVPRLIPNIEVCVKDFEDSEVWDALYGFPEAAEDEPDHGSEEASDSENKDLFWFAFAKSMLLKPVEESFIKELKRKWHPSRRVTAGEHYESGREIGGYYTDSEHETAGPYKPKSCDCSKHPEYSSSFVSSYSEDDDEDKDDDNDSETETMGSEENMMFLNALFAESDDDYDDEDDNDSSDF